MNRFDPARFVGQYLVPYPLVQSVYALPDGGSYRELRDWPFLCTAATATTLTIQNTTTGHFTTVELSEVFACQGDLDATPNYLRPLTLQMCTQLCWDSLRLWREPLPHRQGLRHRRPTRH
jgi:hypothetical protein